MNTHTTTTKQIKHTYAIGNNYQSNIIRSYQNDQDEDKVKKIIYTQQPQSAEESSKTEKKSKEKSRKKKRKRVGMKDHIITLKNEKHTKPTQEAIFSEFVSKNAKYVEKERKHRRRKMLKKNGRVHEAQLEDDLIMLGMHMGHDQYFDNPYTRGALLGHRNNFSVFDIRQTAWSMRRAVNFLREASFNGCNSLFYYTHLNRMSQPFQLFVFHTMQREKQSYLSEWKPGLLTNFSSLTGTFAQRIEGGKKMNLDTNAVELFLRVLYKTGVREISGKRQVLDVEKDSENAKLWKLYQFYKGYRNFYTLPDVLVSINPTNVRTPIEEAKVLRLPVVSIVDSNQTGDGVTYPIYGNDDSPIAIFFFFQLYMNAYKLGRMDRYLHYKAMCEASTDHDNEIERIRESDLAIPSLL